MSIQLPLSQTWSELTAQAASVEPRRTDKVTAVAPAGNTAAGNTSDGAGSATSRAAQQGSPGDKAAKGTLFADPDEGFTFWDFLDVINPLQHIPLVNTLYREATGDQIGAGARVLGGAMFGPIGLIGGALDVAMSEITGDTLGGHVVALFSDDEATDGNGETALASGDTPTAPLPAAAQPQVMTAAESGVLLPMAGVPPKASGTASAFSQLPSGSPPAPALADGATLMAAQEASTQQAAATAPKQPGYMPLKRDEPTFIPLAGQARGAAMPLPQKSISMPLPQAATPQPLPQNAATIPAPPAASTATAAIQPAPEAIQRALAQQGLSIETIPLSHLSAIGASDKTASDDDDSRNDDQG